MKPWGIAPLAGETMLPDETDTGVGDLMGADLKNLARAALTPKPLLKLGS